MTYLKKIIIITTIITTIAVVISPSDGTSLLSTCRSSCGEIPIRYPFGIDDGCGASQLRGTLNCSSSSQLFMSTNNNLYKVQSIDYEAHKVSVFDPAASTCSVLQAPRQIGFESSMIVPSSDTAFALLNCSVDSPVLNRYSYLCYNFSGHSCDELYSDCNAFRVFRFLSKTNSSPPCCFTGYDTMRFMSMNILDCSHYTTVINIDTLKGVGALDWIYAMKFTYSVPDTGCDRCTRSGGTCGFDTDSAAPLCLCSPSSNHTRDCGNVVAEGQKPSRLWQAHFISFVLFFFFVL